MAYFVCRVPGKQVSTPLAWCLLYGAGATHSIKHSIRHSINHSLKHSIKPRSTHSRRLHETIDQEKT